MGASNNLCMIYALLTVPLHSLQITHGRTSDALPLSNAYKTRFLISATCMTIAAAKPPGLIITSLILPHPTLTAIACQYPIIMIGHPQCSLYATEVMLLHVIVSLWSHWSILMMRRSQEHSSVLNTFLRNHTTFMMR